MPIFSFDSYHSPMRNVEGGTGIQQGEAFSEMQTINIAARKKDAQVT